MKDNFARLRQKRFDILMWCQCNGLADESKQFWEADFTRMTHFNVRYLYSGLTFSHYEWPFPSRDCIPYVRSGLYQLVMRVKVIHVCALHCVRAITSIRMAFEVLSFSAWTPTFRFRESSCVSLAHVPHWLFLLRRLCKAVSAAANQKPFVNKDLCTRKSV